MPHSAAVLIVGGMLAVAAASLPARSRAVPQTRAAGTGDSVFVTAAHGQALVPVRIITARAAVLSATGNGKWSGDTLVTRTPLSLVVRNVPSVITFQAVAEHGAVRVTLPVREGGAHQTMTGPEVLLRTSPDGRSLSRRTPVP